MMTWKEEGKEDEGAWDLDDEELDIDGEVVEATPGIELDDSLKSARNRR